MKDEQKAGAFTWMFFSLRVQGPKKKGVRALVVAYVVPRRP